MRLHIFFIFLFSGIVGRTQLYLPLTDYYQNEVNRSTYKDAANNFYSQHLSLKPILDTRINTEALYNSNEKHYHWITQKLFKENLIVFEGENYWCSIDPILDLELGANFSQLGDTLDRLYWNTRGIRVQAKFFDKVAFTTTFYENQALIPQYQKDYIDQFGEFFPTNNGLSYTQNHAVIPGYARTKPFKTTGYDFAFAQGTVSYVPNKNLNFQFGNGNQFIGDGYRSLLLSDFTVNYPFAKIEANLWNGRIQYNTIYALHQNLYRVPQFTTPEATYEKKIGAYHYLDIAISKNLQVGFFEGNLWKRVDSLGTHEPDFLFMNPLPFVNTLLKGSENDGFNAIIGLNAKYRFLKHFIHGQLIIDQKKLGGFQIGAKFHDLILPKLDLGIEYNEVALNTYLSPEKRYNYSHYNLPIAHPYVNGFKELTLFLSYERKRFFVHNRFNYSQRTKNESILIGNNILENAKFDASNIDSYRDIILYNQFEIGYRFNKTNNLQAFIGHLYRNQLQPTNNPLTNYTYIGVRTKLKNKYLDY